MGRCDRAPDQADGTVALIDVDAGVRVAKVTHRAECIGGVFDGAEWSRRHRSSARGCHHRSEYNPVQGIRSIQVNPTDTGDPNYFHKVVDCQWACPAHTNVPEYIRLIAQGRYTDAYMLNRESNVFPGILGRTCDRPCEPACRRDARRRQAGRHLPPQARRRRPHATTSRDRLPGVPTQKNGKRVACIGAGPASLTVANDLMPLGYEVVDLREARRARRPDAHQHPVVPAARPRCSTTRSTTILDMGVDIRYNTPVDEPEGAARRRASTPSSSAPARRAARTSTSPAATRRDRIHIGIDWLESVAFGHIDTIGERVLIIGVGNTAMDCCRTSRRLGGKDIKVMARRPRRYFKASPWELEDAEEEEVEIVVNHAPKRFVIENGKLVGMEFERLEWDEQARALDA